MSPRLVPILCAFAAASCHPLDTRTAVELERDAARHRAEAATGRALANLEQTTLPPPTGPEAQFARAEPTTGPLMREDIRGRVGFEEGRADQEERAARRLRETAEIACSRVPPEQRATSCPIGRLAPGSLTAIRDGVQIRLPPLVEEALAARVMCYVARAQVEPPPDDGTCPLLVRGADARIVHLSMGAALEITAGDEVRAHEIRRRATALAGGR